MLYLPVLLLGVLIDQLTKWLIVSNLPLDGGFEVIPGILRIHYVQNTGAAWSMFSENTLALAMFSLFVLVLLGFWFYKTPTREVWQRLALAVIMAGALGNMIDRFRLGYVVDFIQLPHWPVFNVADMLLCCGVAALAFLLLKDEFRQKPEEAGHE